MPAGICTIDSSESMPFSALLCTGTPSTGKTVFAASMPGRCAAPPAPAMIARRPRACAVAAYSNNTSGVRCADTTRTSCGTPSASSFATACCIVSQSEREPITTPISGACDPVSGWPDIVVPRLKTYSSDPSPAAKPTVMPMDRKLLDILACPATRQPLMLLDAAGVEALNRAIAANAVKRADGSAQSEPLREALITQDRKLVYRIDDGIPVLLIEDGIPYAQVEAA